MAFRLKRGVTLALALVCVWAAGHFNRRLFDIRRADALGTGADLQNASPLMVFTTVVLGGFRGLIADCLWLRVSYLQDAGQYVEMVQLSDWITKLEPYCTEIWAFHAWNMAYNVSVMFAAPEDRWRWVENGVRLLKEEGLRYNSTDARLYFELGWLYQHKMGAALDTAYLYYQRQLARDVAAALPDGRIGDGTDPAKFRDAFGDRYRMELETMREIDRQYGPLDWRLPQPHAIYWAVKGKRFAREKDLLACDRMIYQAMAMLVRQGHVTFGVDQRILGKQPDFTLLPKAIATFEACVKAHSAHSVRTAYENFLKRAILILREHGKETDGRKVFNLLQKRFPSAVGRGTYEEFMKE